MAQRNGKPGSSAQRSRGQRRSSAAAQARRKAEYQRRKRQKWTIRIITGAVILAMIVTMVLSFVSCNRNRTQPPVSSAETEPAETAADSGTQPDPSGVVKLTAVGDIIAHDTILNLAYTGSGYDFSSLFSPLKADISRMDLAIANVETPLGGGPYTGYPNFNTPDEMGLAVIDAGFDVALQASNHSMDAGTDGIRHSIGFWKQHTDQILMTGMHESQAEADAIPLITVNGITFSVLNYTYGLNGYELPWEESYLVTLMNDSTRDMIYQQVQQAAAQSDFVIVCPHWGEENQVGEPTAFQRDWAALFTEAGADLILGTHPHVIENIEWVSASNGNQALCYYSLGNFVSNQQYTDLVLGGMAYVEIEKTDSGAAIREGKAIPVVTHNDKTGDPAVIYACYLADYSDGQAAVHDTYLSFDPDFSVGVLQQKAQAVFGSWLLDRLP